MPRLWYAVAQEHCEDLVQRWKRTQWNTAFILFSALILPLKSSSFLVDPTIVRLNLKDLEDMEMEEEEETQDKVNMGWDTEAEEIYKHL